MKTFVILILFLFLINTYANQTIYSNPRIVDGRFIVKHDGNTIVNVSLKDVNATLLEVPDLIQVPKNASPEMAEAIGYLNADAKFNKAKRYIIAGGKKVEVTLIEMFEFLNQKAAFEAGKKSTPLSDDQKLSLIFTQKEISQRLQEKNAEVLKITQDPSRFKTYRHISSKSTRQLIDETVKSSGNIWMALIDGNTYLLGNLTTQATARMEVIGPNNPSPILRLATPRRDLFCSGMSRVPLPGSQTQVCIDQNCARTSIANINNSVNVISISTVNNNGLCRNDTVFSDSMEGAQ